MAEYGTEAQLIRTATSDDAAAIAAVFDATWEESKADPILIAAAIAEPDHDTRVAVADGCIVGFVAGFLTLASDGQRRWEVDLLAVHPDFRGHKLAVRLVAGSLVAGREESVEFARALIAEDNLASQRSFARHGFVMGEACELWVASGLDTENASPDTSSSSATYLLPVVTFTYSGIWLEPPLTSEGFHRARRTVQKHKWETAGAVIPKAQPEAIALAEAAGYTRIGTYHFWHKRLSNLDQHL